MPNGRRTFRRPFGFLRSDGAQCVPALGAVRTHRLAVPATSSSKFAGDTQLMRFPLAHSVASERFMQRVHLGTPSSKTFDSGC
jgi:hypothetical protein